MKIIVRKNRSDIENIHPDVYDSVMYYTYIYGIFTYFVCIYNIQKMLVNDLSVKP